MDKLSAQSKLLKDILNEAGICTIDAEFGSDQINRLVVPSKFLIIDRVNSQLIYEIIYKDDDNDLGFFSKRHIYVEEIKEIILSLDDYKNGKIVECILSTLFYNYKIKFNVIFSTSRSDCKMIVYVKKQHSANSDEWFSIHIRYTGLITIHDDHVDLYEEPISTTNLSSPNCISDIINTIMHK